MDSGLVVNNLIEKCIVEKNNFIVNGGAGSGKTYTLIQTLKCIFNANNKARVACITYTKVAAKEIKKRVNITTENFYVSTIHEFLWFNISNFQRTIKSIIQDMYSGKIDKSLSISFPQDFNLDDFSNNIQIIQYRDYRKISEGVISHDDVIKIAYYMYKNYNKICDITNDKYDFILIDEYQDSFKSVIDIFLDEMSKIKGKNCVIGLFGDPMQKIYQTGIGAINNSSLVVINKDDNWRSSQIIVDLINKFRNDGIIQVAKGENKDYKSKCTFTYSNTKEFFEIKDYLYEKGYVNKNDEYKELYLTHNLIGKLNGCKDLFSIFSDKEKLIGENKDDLIKHLEKIETIRLAYIEKRHNEIIKKLNIEIDTVKKKRDFYELLSKTFNDVECTIGDIIDLCDNNGLVCKDDKFIEKINIDSELYNNLKRIMYKQYINCYQYANHNTPFSTQHGVKGEEYNNVVVVLDNGNWKLYDYSKVLNGETTDSKYERSLKIMYVSFSRAKKNLCVFYSKPNSNIIESAKKLFGENNVIEID